MLDRVRRFLPHVTAAFIVFHLAASCADAIPDVSQGLHRENWKQPRVREELVAWSDRTGIPLGTLEDLLFDAGTVIAAVRDAVTTPFRPYLHAIGIRQRWGMFEAGTRYRDRFVLSARTCPTVDTGCDWEIRYRRGDDEHQAHAWLLETTRFRSAVASWSSVSNIKKSYRRGCDAVAALFFADDPAIVAVRCGFERGFAQTRDKPATAWAFDDKSALVVTRAAR